MKNRIKICFVCTENIGRSLAAEYCLKTYLKKQHIENIEVISAGTTGVNNDISKHCFAHFKELEKLGADFSKHQRIALNQEIIDECDIVIAMSENHQEWIKENFGVNAPLFYELIDGSKQSIRVPSPDIPECDPFLRKMVKDLYNAMPILIKNIRKQLNKINKPR